MWHPEVVITVVQYGEVSQLRLRAISSTSFIMYLPTVLAREVMQSLPSVCPSDRLCARLSARLRPFYLRNRLTADLELWLATFASRS